MSGLEPCHARSGEGGPALLLGCACLEITAVGVYCPFLKSHVLTPFPSSRLHSGPCSARLNHVTLPLYTYSHPRQALHVSVGRYRFSDVVAMREMHGPELWIGEKVLVDAPRTSWNNRHKTLHRIESWQGSFGWMILDGSATRFPLGQLSRL